MKITVVALTALIFQSAAASPHQTYTVDVAPRAVVANDALARVSRYTVTGTGCPEKSSASIKYIDETTLTIIFDKFGVIGAPQNGGAVRHVTHCDIEIFISFSSRFLSANLSSVFRSDITVPTNASSSMTLGSAYGWDGLAERYPDQVTKFPGPYDKVVTVSQTVPAYKYVPKCRAFNGSLMLSYESEISTWSRDESRVQIFSLDYTVTSVPRPQGAC